MFFFLFSYFLIKCEEFIDWKKKKKKKNKFTINNGVGWKINFGNLSILGIYGVERNFAHLKINGVFDKIGGLVFEKNT